MTQTLTTERLREIASSPSFSSSPLSHEVKYMARELLANREAQPVGYIMPDDVEHLKSGDVVVVVPNNSYCKFPLYTAPPAPAVPEETNLDSARMAVGFNRYIQAGYVDGWNACRAAMLAQPVSQGCKLNSPETPDGWVACSERMPPVNDVVITSNNDSVSVCLSEASAKYRYFTSIVSGREVDVTHWMPLPAAPEGGN